MLSEEKNKEINKLTNEVNNLFRERNYFKTIMDGYSHVSEGEVKSKYDENQKYKDGTDFFYPLIDEYERGTIRWNFDGKDYSIPSPDTKSGQEYSDFKCLICCKKDKKPKFFKDYTFDSICSGMQLYYRDSEDGLLRLSGDRLFHFPQLMPDRRDCKREDAFSLLKKELKKDDSLRALINTFIKASALPGGYIFWRVTEDPKDEDKKEGSGVNSTRGGNPLGDRFDLALEALREWFTESRDVKRNPKHSLLVAFDAEKDAGYPFFLNKGESGWKDFVNFFELKGSFVDDDYRVYNQVASDPLKEEMGVAFDPDEWDTCTLRKSWSDPRHGEGIPPEIENYLINGIRTIVERTKSLNKILPAPSLSCR